MDANVNPLVLVGVCLFLFFFLSNRVEHYTTPKAADIYNAAYAEQGAKLVSELKLTGSFDTRDRPLADFFNDKVGTDANEALTIMKNSLKRIAPSERFYIGQWFLRYIYLQLTVSGSMDFVWQKLPILKVLKDNEHPITKKAYDMYPSFVRVLAPFFYS